MDNRASWTLEESTKRRSEWTREAESEMNSRALREKNKRIATIYEDEDIPYVPAEDEETVIDRFKKAAKLRAKQIAEAFRQIRQCRDVELCFLVDATGSMQSHINEVRKQIQAIVSKLTDTDPHVSFAVKGGEAIAQKLKVAFVAYRDHGDSNQFEIFSFSHSIKDFKTFLSKIVATGGGDAPEDVFGGLENAINLNWSENAGCKVIFHICDTPCHGNTFHSGLSDSHAAGDPKGRTHTALFSKLRSQGIQYHFGKINNTTDIMIKKFSEAYGEPIIDFSVKDVEKIRESVITAVSVSVSASISASKALSRRKEKVYKYEKAEPDWSLCPVHKGKFLSYDFPDSIQSIIDDIPLEKRQTKSAEVQIAPNPFAKGAERVAFYGVDVSTYVDKPPPSNLKNKTLRHRSTRGAAKPAVKREKVSPSDIKKKNEKIVLKEYLHEGTGMNSAKRYELSNHLQTVAAYMAKKFCEEVKKVLKMNVIIKFTKIRTLSISGVTDRFMSCEILFGKDSKFIRFTNNATYEIMEEKAISLGVSTKFVQLVMAFSHWTYKVTKGFLMVVDLEGIVSTIGTGENAILLTDPSIHCEDLTRYGKMNHGEKGMINFFSHHKCNSFCRSLGLESCKPDDF